jgi:hypothetical protein
VAAETSPQTIAGNFCTRLRRIFSRIQGVPTGASSNDATVGATPKAGQKTSKLVQKLTEIALRPVRMLGYNQWLFATGGVYAGHQPDRRRHQRSQGAYRVP